MRAVLQRVNFASVEVEGKIVGKIEKGLMVLVGFIPSDMKESTLSYMLEKITGLRIFEDENDKMNLSVLDIEGGLLIVPNFTLYADARKGRRPGFSGAASPKEAEAIFQKFVEKAEKELPILVQKGIFQSYMKVELENDGPVTILLDSEKNF